jgi:hypothetical protein
LDVAQDPERGGVVLVGIEANGKPEATANDRTNKWILDALGSEKGTGMVRGMKGFGSLSKRRAKYRLAGLRRRSQRGALGS